MKIKTEASSLSLPTERSGASDNLLDYLILITGEKKIGKTTLTGHMGKKPLHLMFEPGGKAAKLYQRPVAVWDDFKAYIRLLKSDKSFGPIVCDTADMMYRVCFEHVCRKLGIDHPSDEGYGKGWDAVRQELMLTIGKLAALGRGIVLISHTQEKEVKKRNGESHHLIVPSMSGQARDIFEPLVDIWCYYHYDGDRRVMQILGDDQVSAGHRIEEHFKYTDGTPIKKIDMGKSSREAYDQLIRAWENKLVKKGGGTEPREEKRIKMGTSLVTIKRRKQ